MEAQNANQKRELYNYPKLVDQFATDCPICAEEGLHFALCEWGIINSVTRIVNPNWLHLVHIKQGEEYITASRAGWVEIDIQEAYFTERAAKVLVEFATIALKDFVGGSV